MDTASLTPANCWKLQSAVVMVSTLYGSELWWNGQAEVAKRIQIDIVNKCARDITGAFKTTNIGKLMAEAGTRPAVSYLNNRKWRFDQRVLLASATNPLREVGAR